MRAVDCIIKKRDGGVLTKEEIEFFVHGFTTNEIPDYQVSAWAMAILLNGMTAQETTDLTMAMVKSGNTLDLSGVVPIAVDKHSTGGVGDKTTLVVEPIVAACGLAVGKMSGRGLGFSGGTLDKMESFPGFRTNLSKQEFIDQLRNVGLVLTGQTEDLAPADGKLYALRDVTGTVPSLPLIASSVMSKKIAGGAHAIVLDVKTGEGAFMKTIEEAKKLAKLMVSIGKLSNRKVVGLISDMNQPLGFAIGNSLEVIEAIDTLHGKGPEDFTEHCMVVASHMLVLGEKAADLKSARSMAEKVWKNGAAWLKFRTLVAAQGGDTEYADQPDKFPKAKIIRAVGSERRGYISEVNAREFGETSVELGAGRERKGDAIDHSVGIILHKKVGDVVELNEPIFTIHSNDQQRFGRAKVRLLNAVKVTTKPCKPLPLFYAVVK